MSTYVAITRAEFEDWLNDIGFRGKWSLKSGTGGVYALELSDLVAVEINSTTGTRDSVRDVGEASMSVKLVAIGSGRVLNKKAQGQSHFARTLNWRKNWKAGIDRMQEAYIKAKEFYDRLASVEDPAEYMNSWLTLIERAPGWKTNTFLTDLHGKVSKGTILSPKQEAAIEKAVSDARETKPAAQEAVKGAGEHPFLAPLRKLYVAARQAPDTWTMDFAASLGQQVKAGRELSKSQIKVMLDKMSAYRIAPPEV